MVDSIRVVFHCDLCGETAVAIALRPEKDGSILLEISEFRGETSIMLAQDRAASFWRLISRQDAAEIYAVDPLIIPSYCPECRRHYCYRHWDIDEMFDEEFPGFYDCSFGFCPQNHRRLIDD